MLAKLKEQQISIVVSTSYMDEAKLCDRIALIQGGKIMSVDKPAAIVQHFPKTVFAARAKDIYRLLQNLRSDKTIESCYAFGEYIHLTLNNENNSEQYVQELAQQYHPQELEIKTISPTIEDSFIRLMREQQTIGEQKELSDGK